MAKEEEEEEGRKQSFSLPPFAFSQLPLLRFLPPSPHLEGNPPMVSSGQTSNGLFCNLHNTSFIEKSKIIIYSPIPHLQCK